MQRGIITFTTAELTQALMALGSPVDAPGQNLQLKLTPLAGATATQLELSLDEVERLLDALPLPTANHSTDLSSLRQKLQMFVTVHAVA